MVLLKDFVNKEDCMNNLKKLIMLGFVMSCSSLMVAMISDQDVNQEYQQMVQDDPGLKAAQLANQGDFLGLMALAKTSREEIKASDFEILDRQTGLSPLHVAAIQNHHEVLKIVFRLWSPDVNILAEGNELNFDKTPIHFAALKSSSQAIKELLKQSNIDLMVKDFNDETALDIARRVKRTSKHMNALFSLKYLEAKMKELGLDEPQREEDSLSELEREFEGGERAITNVTPEGGSEGSLEGSNDDESLMKDGSVDPEYLRKRSMVKKAWDGYLGNYHNYLRKIWGYEAARKYIVDEYEKLLPEQKRGETVLSK